MTFSLRNTFWRDTHENNDKLTYSQTGSGFDSTLCNWINFQFWPEKDPFRANTGPSIDFPGTYRLLILIHEPLIVVGTRCWEIIYWILKSKSFSITIYFKRFFIFQLGGPSMDLVHLSQEPDILVIFLSWHRHLRVFESVDFYSHRWLFLST